jgi:MraZ protein
MGGTMFRGVVRLNLDAKGRMAMPARYREGLQAACNGELILTINVQDRCLWLYPLPAWEEIEAKLTALSSFDPQTVRLKRLLMGHATECELDGQGRISVPSMLREYAALDKRVVLMGQGNKFEVWDEAAFGVSRGEWLDTSDGELSEGLKNLAL